MSGSYVAWREKTAHFCGCRPWWIVDPAEARASADRVFSAPESFLTPDMLALKLRDDALRVRFAQSSAANSRAYSLAASSSVADGTSSDSSSSESARGDAAPGGSAAAPAAVEGCPAESSEKGASSSAGDDAPGASDHAQTAAAAEHADLAVASAPVSSWRAADDVQDGSLGNVPDASVAGEFVPVRPSFLVDSSVATTSEPSESVLAALPTALARPETPGGEPVNASTAIAPASAAIDAQMFRPSGSLFDVPSVSGAAPVALSPGLGFGFSTVAAGSSGVQGVFVFGSPGQTPSPNATAAAVPFDSAAVDAPTVVLSSSPSFSFGSLSGGSDVVFAFGSPTRAAVNAAVTGAPGSASSSGSMIFPIIAPVAVPSASGTASLDTSPGRGFGGAGSMLTYDSQNGTHPLANAAASSEHAFTIAMSPGAANLPAMPPSVPGCGRRRSDAVNVDANLFAYSSSAARSTPMSASTPSSFLRGVSGRRSVGRRSDASSSRAASSSRSAASVGSTTSLASSIVAVRTSGPYIGLIDVYSSDADMVRKPWSKQEVEMPCLLYNLAPHVDNDIPDEHFFNGTLWDADVGDSCVVSRTEFKRQFNYITGGILDGLDWTHVLLAGGSVLAALDPLTQLLSEPCKTRCCSDLDLFVHGVESDSEAQDAVRHIFDVVLRNSGGSAPLEVIRTDHALTVVGKFPTRRHVQIVLRLYSSPAEVLHGFDIDSCSVGYDGTDVWATERARRALQKRYNLVDLSRRSLTYETRLSKYAKRGFAVIVPGVCFDYVHPRVGKLALRNVSGLARLLIADGRLSKAPVDDEDESDYSIAVLGWSRGSCLAALRRRQKSLAFRMLSSNPEASYPALFVLGTADSWLAAPLKWVRADPGRQLLSGSFHPVDVRNWMDDAYGLSGPLAPSSSMTLAPCVAGILMRPYLKPAQSPSLLPTTSWMVHYESIVKIRDVPPSAILEIDALLAMMGYTVLPLIAKVWVRYLCHSVELCEPQGPCPDSVPSFPMITVLPLAKIQHAVFRDDASAFAYLNGAVCDRSDFDRIVALIAKILREHALSFRNGSPLVDAFAVARTTSASWPGHHPTEVEFVHSFDSLNRLWAAVRENSENTDAAYQRMLVADASKTDELRSSFIASMETEHHAREALNKYDPPLDMKAAIGHFFLDSTARFHSHRFFSGYLGAVLTRSVEADMGELRREMVRALKIERATYSDMLGAPGETSLSRSHRVAACNLLRVSAEYNRCANFRPQLSYGDDEGNGADFNAALQRTVMLLPPLDPVMCDVAGLRSLFNVLPVLSDNTLALSISDLMDSDRKDAIPPSEPFCFIVDSYAIDVGSETSAEPFYVSREVLSDQLVRLQITPLLDDASASSFMQRVTCCAEASRSGLCETYRCAWFDIWYDGTAVGVVESQLLSGQSLSAYAKQPSLNMYSRASLALNFLIVISELHMLHVGLQMVTANRFVVSLSTERPRLLYTGIVTCCFSDALEQAVRMAIADVVKQIFEGGSPETTAYFSANPVAAELLDLLGSSADANSFLRFILRAVSTAARLVDRSPDGSCAECARLSAENARLQESTACLVCLERPSSVILLPCYHSRLCRPCAERLQDCPVCRREISTIKNVFT